MFYCKLCAEKNQYPESISQSRGTCELCNTYAVCFDVPSSAIEAQMKLNAAPEVGAAIDEFLRDPDSGSYRTR